VELETTPPERKPQRAYNRGMRFPVRVAVLFAVAGLSALLGAGGVDGAPRKAKSPARGAAAECQADTECVLAPDGCCGCNEGGKQRALPARARDAYEKKRKAVCRNSACPALMSEDASCVSGHPVCTAGKCTLGT
jgi:hypothetical protein